MPTRLPRWDRTCPDCRTTFSSVQSWGVCPQCSLRFGVDEAGNVIISGNRPDDRIQPRVLEIPDNVQDFVDQLPPAVVSRVRQEFPSLEQTAVLEYLACLIPKECGSNRICNAILDRARGYALGVRHLVITAQSDWRDVLW
ncbi:MAG: hypothetical protein QM775_14330 [Pirellulales bacterium]